MLYVIIKNVKIGGKMNQILFVQDKHRNNPADTKKIVFFFAVTITIFGLILLAQGIYGAYTSYQEQLLADNISSEVTQIQLSQTDDGNVLITVESQNAISELIYNWNSEASQTISENGKTTIQETITMPVGENTLTVRTIDVNGNETTKQETFTLNVDKPVINLSLLGDKIKITVTSKVDLSYITYKWNSDNEERIDMLTYEDKTTLETEIDIPVGQNTLLVTAVDIYENTAEKSQEIRGVTKPKSQPVIQGNYIFFEVTADENIEKVEFSLNDKAYVISSDVIGESNTVKYRLELNPGMNYLKITTTTVSGFVVEELWTYNY